MPAAIKQPNTEALQKMYCDKGMSAREIAQSLGVGCSTVNRWLKQHRLPVRSNTEANAMPRRRDRLSLSKRGCGHVSRGYRCESRRSNGRKNIVPLHRQIAAAILGRELDKNEVVHHVNNCKADNRPANLWVFSSQSAHALFHKTGAIDRGIIKLVPFA